MLLVLPVPFRSAGNQLLFEAQACNGLNRWADNFSHVVAAAPVMPEYLAQADKTMVWQNTGEVLDKRIQCIPLPWAYSPVDFVRQYWRWRKVLAQEIRRCEYLQFAIGNLIGDWGSVAAMEAKKQGRLYAIHTDRVESNLMRKLVEGKSGPRAWRKTIEAAMMDRYHESIIRQCSAGLWHGQECYAAYSPWCRNNHLIHDVHTKKADAISEADLERKAGEIPGAAELRIAYAGRMTGMKAPLEWLKAIAHARDLGAAVKATWYGDGELRGPMEAEISALNLGGIVRLAGFVSDRQVLLAGLREAHLMLFTHVTPESPRCLLEALICGTPIIGYDNAFARDLTEERGGGAYVAMHDWRGLGEKVAELAGKRGEMVRMVREAAANGRRFNDEELFRERSLIIKGMAA